MAQWKGPGRPREEGRPGPIDLRIMQGSGGKPRLGHLAVGGVSGVTAATNVATVGSLAIGSIPLMMP